ncbi:Gp19 phage tail fiber protein [Sodalis praecaptivus]|uniref:Gp19 phage tail fiber protein n=1 Tax=Sodalis praecaptivus TaxID=1239307 RepID=W0HUX4_9GAMM|nr:phage tail protein [Sodalis praecaptivus]AHF77564.1 Gp19 phage tail fiber protein [Sodalis praecaptivus]
MSQTVITLAFEQWKAQQAITQDAIELDEFVFANVPEMNPDIPIDRTEGIPPAAQIVHRQAVSRKGVVNDNAVVHSAVLGAEVGDFSFNWIGLINKASGTLAMIVHAPIQQKLKTASGQQGNVLTRSFLMEFDGAQVETGINTPAETWQIDFTARMTGMDERQRRENVDIYGAAAFFGDGWRVGKTGKQFFITKGAGYVAGLRAELVADQNITVTDKPITVWLDVCWTGTLISVWGVETDIKLAADLADYEKDGVQHYVFALAGIDADGAITDLRPNGSLDGQAASDALKRHEQSRHHPDATTSAKGFVQLSSATNSASEKYAATPKAVKEANDNANSRLLSDNRLAEIDAAGEEAQREAQKNIGLTAYGIQPALEFTTGTDVNSLKANGRFAINEPVNGPVTGKAGYWLIDVQSFDSQATGDPLRIIQIANGYGISGSYQNRTFRRTYKGSANWSNWIEIYSEENKPTPADIEAFPVAGGTVGSLGVTTPSLKVTKKASFNSMVKMLGEGKNNNGEVRSAGSLFYPYGDTSDQSVEFYTVDIVNSHLEARLIVNKAGKGRYFRFKDDGTFVVEGECQAGNGQARLATNGDVTGPIWEGNLSSWIMNRTQASGGRSGWWYRDASSGFILQGGVVNRSGDNTQVNFPIGYRKECFGVQMTLSVWRKSSKSNIFATSIENTGFTAVMYDQEVEANWWAVGV